MAVLGHYGDVGPLNDETFGVVIAFSLNNLQAADS